MIECYWRWCEYHCKDEPFCSLYNDCLATNEQVIEFRELRKLELQSIGEVPID